MTDVNRKKHLWVLGWLLSVLFQNGCQCEDPEILATLSEIKGTVHRDFAAAVNQWEGADIGGEFRLGDGIRSQHASGAVLALNEGSLLRLEPNSQLRFLTTLDGKKGKGIDVETGSAELVVGEADLSLVTSMGRAAIASGSVVRLEKKSKGLSIAVEIGTATFFDKNNAATTVAAGEGIVVDIGAAILDKFSLTTPTDTEPEKAPEGDTDKAAVAQDTEPEAPEDEPKEAPTADANRHESHEVVDIPEGPSKADFPVGVGESFVVHAPAVPVAVAFETGKSCPKGAAIHLDRQWTASGQGTVRVAMDAGRHRYRIKCLREDGSFGDDAGKGRIHVIKDAGLARVPGTPPTSFVETDGRRYKIMYQTRPPEIEVAWPRGPRGQKYKLHIDGKKQISTAKPSYKLASGALSEGTHQLKFEAVGAMARMSRTTTVEIRFDNAAPKASLTAPADGSFGPGSTVKVKGTAMANWKITLMGGTIEKDAQHRFEGAVPYSGAFMSIALRLSHHRRGVHYYIRRARGEGL